MKFKALVVAVVGLMAVASAYATPVVNNNVRNVAIGGSGGEPILQSALDTVFGAGVVSATNDQSTAGLWGAAAFPATTIPTLVLEASGGASVQKFGIWFGTDSASLLTYDLLLGGASTGGPFPAAAGLALVNGALQVTGADCGVAINCGTVVDSRINPYSFGFYFQTGNGNIAYSIDSLNVGGETRFLALTDGSSTNWAFAYEDGNDFDYNDMVVKVESIKVPEPGSLALLGLSLAALGGLSRRRKA